MIDQKPQFVPRSLFQCILQPHPPRLQKQPQLNPAQLITADLWIDFFAQHFNVPPQNVAFAESEIRINDFWALFNAVNSGLEVSASMVDRAVECIEKANKAQIEVSDLSYDEKEMQRQKNHTIAECTKIAIKRRLRAEGKLTQ